MTRTPLQRKTPMPQATKPMRQISEKRQKARQSNQGKADLAYMGKVRQLPCIICLEWGLTQLSPTEAHHPIHGRYSNRKAPDRSVIPLCEGHHRGDLDTTKVAIHREPSKWKRLYGEDNEWTARTQDDVEMMG